MEIEILTAVSVENKEEEPGMPKVSIIVPVYRAEAYLPSCVDSIRNQTFSDLEIFLVDDGSPDGCGGICDAYAQKDSRVHVIHQENGGQSAARNRALEQSTAEWVCFVDSDDLIHPQMVQRLYEAAVEYDAGIALCSMAESPEIPQDFFMEPSGKREVLELNEDTLVSLYDAGAYPAWVSCAKLIRREYVTAHPFTEGRVYEDNAAVCHWVCQSPRLVCLEDALYYYRTNLESTTKSALSLKKLDYLWALEEIIRCYKSAGYHTMQQRFVHRYAQELANLWESVCYELHRPDVAKEIEKRGKQFAREMQLSFCLADRERMLEAMHPKLVKLYWPAKGAVRTFREEGIGGVLRKMKKIGRGEP